MSEDIEIIDAHHHFWDLNKNYYPFLSDKIDPDFFLGNYESIRKNYLPVDYIEDIKLEIIEEADEHQLFYAITDELSGFSIASASNDTKDSDGNPLFIKTTWTTTGETSGDVVGYLIHEPTSKTGSTRNDFGGATDFEIEFEVHVEE